MGNLARKLLAGPGIQFVGAVSGASPDATSQALTLDLTALTGGIDTAARTDDIVILVHGGRSGGTGSDQDMGASTSGYAELADLFADDDDNMDMSVSWKRMGSTPDTSVVTTTVGSIRQAAIAYVVRGVNTTTAIDVTTTTATGINSGVANPPAITPVTVGAWVIAVWGNISTATTALTGPAGFSNFVTRANTSISTYPHLCIARQQWTSGAVDPGTCTGVSTNNTLSWAAVTLALRPA